MFLRDFGQLLNITSHTHNFLVNVLPLQFILGAAAWNKKGRTIAELQLLSDEGRSQFIVSSNHFYLVWRRLQLIYKILCVWF